MRWVAGEPGQGRKAAALSRKTHAPWGSLAGAAEIVTWRTSPVDGRCTAILSIADFGLQIADWLVDIPPAALIRCLQSAIRSPRRPIQNG